jgi:hypothetical protein
LEDLVIDGGNTKMQLKVIECEGVEWSNLNQDKDKGGRGLLRKKAMNLRAL